MSVPPPAQFRRVGAASRDHADNEEVLNSIQNGGSDDCCG